DMYHRVFDRVSAVAGEQVWNFADFATSQGRFRGGGNKKGILTRHRQTRSGGVLPTNTPGGRATGSKNPTRGRTKMHTSLL
ncbi:glycoside hydrolase family 2 TIM barrel-domain containing protein, partial [Escherichia coli]|uniref:glycoside hydrolase family 2 TIM barrel-domain containing protein n=1 Tax=Escherichia coli TaxID=562 RepID=UPI0024E18DB9